MPPKAIYVFVERVLRTLPRLRLFLCGGSSVDRMPRRCRLRIGRSVGHHVRGAEEELAVPLARE